MLSTISSTKKTINADYKDPRNSMLGEKISQQFALCFAPLRYLSQDQQKERKRVFAVVRAVLNDLEKVNSQNPEETKKINLLIHATKSFLKLDSQSKDYTPSLVDRGIIQVASRVVYQGAKIFYKETDQDPSRFIPKTLQDIATSTLYVQEVLKNQGITDDSLLQEFKGDVLEYIRETYFPQKS